MRCSRLRISSGVLAAVLAMVIGLAGWPAQAQSRNGSPPAPPPFSPSDLTNIPGLTPYQAANASTIDVLCPKLVDAGLLGQPTATGDLTTLCTQLKVTTTQNQNPQGNAPPLNLGLTEGQLGDVLGQWTHDQATENSRASIEIGARQARTIAGRLAALRLGARGLSVSGLGTGETKTLAWSEVMDAQGGGASADTDLLNRFGVFVNATYAWGDKDPTSREIGFDYDIAGVILGADYRITENLIAGAAFNYAHTSADFQSGLGKTDTNSFGGLLYATYYLASFFVDGYVGYNGNLYDTERRIVYGTGPGATVPAGTSVNRTAAASPSGQQLSFGLGGGYDFALGAATITPLIRTEFIGLHVDGYTESGADGLNLKVAQQKATSFVTALGAQFSYAFSLPFGILVPTVRAEWRHEYLNDSRGIRAQYAADPCFGGVCQVFAIPTDSPDRDYASLNFGIASAFKGGWQGFFNYELIVGLRDINYNQLTAGVRFEF